MIIYLNIIWIGINMHPDSILKNQKRIALPLLASSVLLFYGGAAFAYFVVFPLIFAFFTSVGPENVQVMTDINSYLDFVLKLFLAFGIAFEMPIAAVILIWTGVTSPDALAKKRQALLGVFLLPYIDPSYFPVVLSR